MTMINDIDRFERVKKSGGIHYNMEAKKCIADLKDEFHSQLDSMSYFYDIMENIIHEPESSDTEEKVIASMCIHVPVELIYAAGARPVRVCGGAYATDQVGADFLPAKTCPMVKSTAGALYLGLLPGRVKPKLVVNPSSCDQKKKLGEVVSGFDDEFYLLELPPNKDTEESREYWHRVVKRFAKKLESVTGKRITRRNLKKAIKLVSTAQGRYRHFHKLRSQAPVIFGKDAILITNAFFFDDLARWTEKLDELNREMELRIEKKKHVVHENAPRILLTGSPAIFPNLKLPILIEKMGGLVACEEYCSSSRMLTDSIAVDEWFLYDMIPAIADRYLKPSTCPNFSPNEDRIRKILSMIKEFNIDGVVYQSFTGCQLYDMESITVGKAMDEINMPTLYLESDYNPDDSGQLITRVEAFLESVKNK